MYEDIADSHSKLLAAKSPEETIQAANEQTARPAALTTCARSIKQADPTSCWGTENRIAVERMRHVSNKQLQNSQHHKLVKRHRKSFRLQRVLPISKRHRAARPRPRRLQALTGPVRRRSRLLASVIVSVTTHRSSFLLCFPPSCTKDDARISPCAPAAWMIGLGSCGGRGIVAQGPPRAPPAPKSIRPEIPDSIRVALKSAPPTARVDNIAVVGARPNHLRRLRDRQHLERDNGTWISICLSIGNMAIARSNPSDLASRDRRRTTVRARRSALRVFKSTDGGEKELKVRRAEGNAERPATS